MRFLVIVTSIIFFALAGNGLVIPMVSLERDMLRQKEGVGEVVPSAVAKVAALEFKGIFADIIFSRTMTYYGAKIIRKEEVTEAEWAWLYKNINLATELDPYFLDPYYFGAMTIAWDANKVKEANLLLEKAIRYRNWDWTLPFYLGFNYFYFLNDNKKAAYYLMEAAKMPGSISLLSTFAARLAYQGKKTENAIIFLQEIIEKTNDDHTKRIYEKRLNALKAILFLERAAAIYQERFKKQPTNLDDLIAKNVIREIPPDPYGGKFYIDKDGSIKTTSELR